MPFGLGLTETLVAFFVLLALPTAAVVLVVRALRGRRHDSLAARQTAEELESARQRLQMLEARLARTEKGAATQSLPDDRPRRP